MQYSKIIFNTADTLAGLLLCDISNECGFLIDFVFYLLIHNYLLHLNLYAYFAYKFICILCSKCYLNHVIRLFLAINPFLWGDVLEISPLKEISIEKEGQ
ncbi:hypothetical protein B4907_11195 [Yersinia kristensenii]|nr:hypothetical protein B4907_11195 [Yersinia kristensenii]